MKIGYGKIGRSMPLTLAKCGTLGGDVEQVAIIKQLAERHPEDDFYLLGRNTGEFPHEADLPGNVVNIWRPTLQSALREQLNAAGLNHPGLSIDEQRTVRQIFGDLGVYEMFEEMDAHVWWVGQHGTTNTPLPSVQRPGQVTKPHDWSAYYVGWVIAGLNRWRDQDPVQREEVWLNADPRNYLKLRDLKWPLRHPVISQFNFEHGIKHERYGDSRTPDQVPLYDELLWDDAGDGVRWQNKPFIWQSRVRNVYARLEINGLAPGTPFGQLLDRAHADGLPTFDERDRFGVFINEARREVTEARSRRVALRDYVLPLQPDFIHGTWSEISQRELGVHIWSQPWEQYVPKLASVKSTFTTPSSGSGWATTKPWEAFAARTVCFFHPLYDTQDSILSDAPEVMRVWLRVKDPDDLREKVDLVSKNHSLYDELATAQWRHFVTALHQRRWLQLVEERIWG